MAKVPLTLETLRGLFDELQKSGRWHRCFFASLAAEVWDDLRRGLLTNALGRVDREQTLTTGELGPGHDFPKSITPEELEAISRMKNLVPFFAEVWRDMTPDRWRTIANQQGLVFDHERPLDLDFIRELGTVLRVKVKNKLPADEPVGPFTQEQLAATLLPTLPVVSQNPPQITIDGTAYALSDDQALYLQELLEAGDWMSDPEFRRRCPQVGKSAKPHRWRGKLPDGIKKYLKTDKRKGSRWLA